ncbi:HAD family hydrolase [Streptomyces sp. SID13031]|uniref:HAD family hydrolase n=1 Tax=Streptomyces sp. SID13031 TaxID=2706046 RepID=UPI0013C77CDF|nr:HAD family hydrolase [Streptomyces sp. SID13031]NEA36268.1 HAD family hydrolase [Streptomyces sp. SID13031]
MKAVVFDLDDTLFDHSSSVAATLRAWVPSFGGGPLTDELVAQWFVVEHRNFELWLAGKLSHQDQRRGRLRDFLPLIGYPVPATDAGLDELFTGFLDRYSQNWAAFPDALPALEVAKSNGWRIGVLTNGITQQQNAKLAAIGLADHIDVVSTSEGLGFSKPAPQSYLLTCQALGVSPAETLMIGDNLDKDVLGARAAGLTAEHLDRAAGVTLAQLVRAV